MNCKELMTPEPVFCVPEDNAVRAAMLMKQHNIGSVPVVSDRVGMKLTGIVTDRDLTLRLIAEQRNYYDTRVSEVMSADMITCRETDDHSEVLKAMAKQQIRRLPVVDRQERLVGIISQADIARKGEAKEVGTALEAISAPSGSADGNSSSAARTGLMVAGGLGLAAGLVYMLQPFRAQR